MKKFLLSLVLSCFLAPAYSTYAQQTYTQQADTWNATGISLRLNFDPITGVGAKDQERSGTLTFDCADASIKHFTLAENGDFMGTGTFTPEHGGPSRPGEPSNNQNANFFAHIHDHDFMTLIIFSEQTPDQPGIFQIQRGAPVKLHRCQ